ncbi:hypothetical protein CRG98_017261 [Punica granatum]|uniref:Uncharacterized protein n=1 Tax=Punica granatum TaxID=22663 RepID=A0A2I0K199_PUNGR|nr:hypothetical protein CRG98_017261 [Punica granatum]
MVGHGCMYRFENKTVMNAINKHKRERGGGVPVTGGLWQRVSDHHIFKEGRRREHRAPPTSSMAVVAKIEATTASVSPFLPLRITTIKEVSLVLCARR